MMDYGIRIWDESWNYKVEVVKKKKKLQGSIL